MSLPKKLLGFSGAVLVLASTTGSPLMAQQRGERVREMPTTFRSNVQEADVWKSTRAFIGADGRVISDRLPALVDNIDGHIDRLIAQASAVQNADCLLMPNYYERIMVGTKTPESAEDLVANANSVLHGKVTDIDGGYYAGQLAVLLRVEVTEWLHRDASYTDSSVVYVPYPYGRVEFAGASVCLHGSPGAYIPEIGDSLFLLPQHGPTDLGGTIVDVSSLEFLADTGGGLIESYSLRNVTGLEDIVNIEDLRRLVAESLRTRRLQ